MNKRACYIGFLFALVVIASALVPLTAVADFSTGEKLSHNLSVCMNKQDAIDIVNAHKDGGREAASKVWADRAGCDNVVIMDYSVGKVAYAVKVEEGIASVVEIVADGKVAGYFITTQPVNKPQRNT